MLTVTHGSTQKRAEKSLEISVAKCNNNGDQERCKQFLQEKKKAKKRNKQQREHQARHTEVKEEKK